MRYDEGSADCRVFTFKDGMLSPLGHDLELQVTRFTVDVSDDKSRVEASFAADSLRVLNATGGAVPLLERDRASIEGTVASEILQARRHPRIEFRSTAISEQEIRGTLTLLGRSREIVCRRETAETATAQIHQPDFGIKPYRAMLGALRLKADLTVRITLR
jgi:polyisoprenoid-binding protein YceI